MVSSPRHDSLIQMSVHQTFICTNVTLYLTTAMALPSVPRIGEEVTFLDDSLLGTVTKVKYTTEHIPDYRDDPDKPLYRLSDLEPYMNRYGIAIFLTNADFVGWKPSADCIKEKGLDQFHLIRASRKEVPTDFNERMRLMDDPDYKIHILRNLYEKGGSKFDGDKFDELFKI